MNFRKNSNSITCKAFDCKKSCVYGEVYCNSCAYPCKTPNCERRFYKSGNFCVFCRCISAGCNRRSIPLIPAQEKFSGHMFGFCVYHITLAFLVASKKSPFYKYIDKNIFKKIAMYMVGQ